MTTQSYKRYFFAFISLHMILWTFGPLYFRHSLPHDSLEGISWGFQYQLGYHKHPPLAAWLSALVTSIGHSTGWPLYLLASGSVALTFWSVWRLGLLIMTPIAALIATLSLEGVLFYNINSFNFTPDSLQSPLWALLALHVYRAQKEQRLLSWVYSAVVAALCVWCKYQAVILFLPLFLFLLIDAHARQSFRRAGIWLALLLTLILISPHIYWLWQQDFISIRYAFNTPSEYTAQAVLWPHVQFPLRFLINSLGNVLGLLILLWPFYRLPQKRPNLFLTFMALGPLIVTLMLCIISGHHFPPRWATPYFFAWGLWLVDWMDIRIDLKKWKQFFVSAIAMMILLFSARMASFYFKLNPSSDAYLPTSELALNLDKKWQERFQQPLKFIGGSRYLVAALSAYSQDKPKPWFSWSMIESPWIDEAALRREGAIFVEDIDAHFVWDGSSGQYTHIPLSIVEQFPLLEPPNELNINGVRIYYRILPPAQVKR